MGAGFPKSMPSGLTRKDRAQSIKSPAAEKAVCEAYIEGDSSGFGPGHRAILSFS